MIDLEKYITKSSRRTQASDLSLVSTSLDPSCSVPGLRLSEHTVETQLLVTALFTKPDVPLVLPIVFSHRAVAMGEGESA